MSVGLFKAFKNSILASGNPKMDAYKILEKLIMKNRDTTIKSMTINPSLYENMIIGQPMTAALYREFR